MTQTTTLDAAAFQRAAGQAAGLMRVLANEHRLMILCRLGAGELSVGALLDGTVLSQSSLSQHLARLRAEGLVTTRREGTTVFYRIADPAALRVVGLLADLYCPDALG